MKNKLERINKNLFVELNPSKLQNLSILLGGEVAATKGTTKVACGNTWYSHNFTDKQKYHLDPKGGVINDGEPYEFVLVDRYLENNGFDYALVSLNYDESMAFAN